MEEINKIPPVTRTMIFATLGVTLPGMLQILSPYVFFLWWPSVIGKFQVWRLFTSFFYGGSGIQLLFDIFLLLRNSTDLETNKFYRKTADYAWALILVGSLIIATNYPLKSPVLFNPLLMAIVYLWSRSNPHSNVSLFGLINCPAKYLPYAYLLFDLLRGGMPYAIQSATGLLSAHIYYFLKEVLPATSGGRGPNYLPDTPNFLRNLLRDSPDPNVQGQETQQGGSVRSTAWGGTAFAPAGRSFGDGASATPSTGGQRLGSTSGGGIRSWLPSFGGGSGGNTGSSTNTSGRTGLRGQSRPDRDAMLAAAEARLRSLRDNSIAGRNQAASAAAAQAANSSEARARASSQSQTPSASAGSTLLGSQASRTTARSQSGTEAVRRAAAGGSAVGGSSHPISFGESRQKGTDEDQETASGSGGRVAEIRRAPSGNDDQKDQDNDDDVQHSWGSGQRLGN
ncbi:hypothetical protein L7F22_039243 [Adiantum nelumboides]|nr:hypothetical protein [Adiantum nelumboides]